MPVVAGMAVTVVDVVDVIPMRYGHVSAAGPMPVTVIIVRHVARGLTLIDVITVHPMQAPVVYVVDVISMRYGDMPATGSMDVVVIGMLTVFGRCGHWSPPR
ncbi:hypothetical protein IMZ11_04160 [Microtetraspora sp. AC03309]|uniref:hypothetical protein n=1 Tax=Microtetraspora sp. AC03309 TaxID=2779376 RepID=UPI001E434436|nr:hypothetical protein [Microtetraspora sp. AC03309]MCC5574829.1 hypothetical protein [Microtetraspora sp. AC03309]